MPTNFLASLILDVSNIERSLAFYGGVLGLALRRRETYELHELAFLGAGEVELLLLKRPAELQDDGFVRSGGMVIKFRVEDLTGAIETLRRLNAQVVQETEAPPGGERTALVADPDGYAVLLAEVREPLT